MSPCGSKPAISAMLPNTMNIHPMIVIERGRSCMGTRCDPRRHEIAATAPAVDAASTFIITTRYNPSIANHGSSGTPAMSG
jgi:hypothetical protein